MTGCWHRQQLAAAAPCTQTDEASVIQQLRAYKAQPPASQVCNARPLQATSGSDMPAMPAASQHLQSTRGDTRSSCHPAALQEQIRRHLVMASQTQCTVLNYNLPACLGNDQAGSERSLPRFHNKLPIHSQSGPPGAVWCACCCH